MCVATYQYHYIHYLLHYVLASHSILTLLQLLLFIASPKHSHEVTIVKKRKRKDL